MSSQSTLSDYSTPDLTTPEGRIRDLIENPDTPRAYDSALNEFWSLRKPVGCDDIYTITDPALVREYIEACRTHLPGDYFADNPMLREVADDKYRVIDRLDAYLKHVEFPKPTEWPVEPAFIEWVQDIDLPEKGDFTFERQSLERVWDTCTASDLQFIRDALRHHYGRANRETSRLDDLLNGFLYYHGAVDLDEIVEVSGRGSGPSGRRIMKNLDVTLSKLDPVIGSLTLYWMNSTITRNRSESGGGHYYTLDKRINISSDGDITKAIDRNWTSNTVAHELCHALHHLYGFFVDGGDSVDNRGKPTGEWEWRAKERPHDSLTTSQGSFMVCIWQEWEDLRDGSLDALSEYQTKNADEFICVAFECWVVNPEKLAAEQPRMKELFDAHFGPQNYEHMQLRLEPMPSPTETAKSC